MSTGSESSSSICEEGLQQQYNFLGKIGEGTYGSAWLAVDKISNTKVVLKAVHKDQTPREHFKNELKYSRLLSGHPHIITTRHDAYETDNAYILVQDFAAGGDLFDAIRPEIGIPEDTAKKYILQIASAVHAMHTKGLVHRDVKPENAVLQDDAGTNIQLIDFGMARRQGCYVNGMCGSIPYMPPEICSAADGYYCHPSTDVWSVGVLLYCLLTGRFPWQMATLTDTNFREFVRWQRGETEKVPGIMKKFSPKLLELFRKLLCLDWRKRCNVTEVLYYVKYRWFIDPSMTKDNKPGVDSLDIDAEDQLSNLEKVTNKEHRSSLCTYPIMGGH
jgi:serine/threonine-protein kinase SBK